MIAAFSVVAMLQQGVWDVKPSQFTVGDSVVLERSVTLPEAAVRLQVDPLETDPAFEPIRAPFIRYQAGGALIRYVIAPFDPREVRVEIPDIDLVYPDGRVESLEGGFAVLTPVAVLPVRGGSDTLPDPRWSQAPIPRGTSRLEPAILLLWLVWSVVLVWWIARRRVGARPVWTADASQADPPVNRWVASGEPRAVAAFVMHHLRARIADWVPPATPSLSSEQCMAVLKAERPEWPLKRVEEILATVGRASFAPAVPSDVLVIVDEIAELTGDLERAEERAAASGEAAA